MVTDVWFAGIDKAQLQASNLAKSGKFLELEEVESEINEGSGHSGMGHVVNCVWQKHS
jgi:hypothetical protein